MAEKSPRKLWSSVTGNWALVKKDFLWHQCLKSGIIPYSKLSSSSWESFLKLLLPTYKSFTSVLALHKQSPCNVFKHCHEKCGAGSVGTSEVPQDGVTKQRCCNTDTSFPVCEQKHKQLWSPHYKICPSVKTSCGKGEKEQEKPDLQTSLLVKLPQCNHARSWEMVV